MKDYPFNKLFNYIETGITSSNGIVPLIFGYEKCNAKKCAIEYDKDVYTIHVVISGSGYVGDTKIKENQCFIMEPHCKKIYRPNSQNPWFYAWIEFNGLSVNSYLSHCGFSETTKVLTLSKITSIAKAFDDIFTFVPRRLNRHSRNMDYTALCLKILSEITEQCGYQDRNKGKSIPTINFENMISFISTNYSNPELNVSYLAKHFSYVPSYLTRLFKKNTGLTPNKYITKVRMENAADLLVKGKANINQITAIVGYQNQFYFSKVFTEYYGIRPSLYIDSVNKN